MPTGVPDPDVAARDYEKTLRNYFSRDWPRFDLVLLGLGEEGHTASLFPGSPALEETRRWVVAVKASSEPPLRLTLTLPALTEAANIYFLVAGRNKAQALYHVLTGSPDPKELPGFWHSPGWRDCDLVGGSGSSGSSQKVGSIALTRRHNHSFLPAYGDD
jgi:6-phosphogluconolactonase